MYIKKILRLKILYKTFLVFFNQFNFIIILAKFKIFDIIEI